LWNFLSGQTGVERIEVRQLGIDLCLDFENTLPVLAYQHGLAGYEIDFRKCSQRCLTPVGQSYGKTGQAMQGIPLVTRQAHHYFHLVTTPLEPVHFIPVVRVPRLFGKILQTETEMFGFRFHAKTNFRFAGLGRVYDIIYARIARQLLL
jgi:hypothetical protein